MSPIRYKPANISLLVAASYILLGGSAGKCHAREVLAAGGGGDAGATAAPAGDPAKPAAAKQAASPPKSALYSSGVALYGQRKYAEAAQAFTRVIRQEPANSDAYYYLGICQHLLGDKAACIKLYEYLVKYFPDSAAAVPAGQYLTKNSSSGADAGSGATSGNDVQMKQAAAALRSAISRVTTAPASIASLVEVVRARADRPNVTSEAVQAIKQAVDRLPVTVKDVLWANKVKIFVTPTVEDYEPGVKYQEARGYEGGTYKSCPAFYSNGKIVIAERTMDEGDDSVKDAFPPNQMVNSFYHETGHALDFCLDDISHSENFKHAYLLDSARVEPATANKLKYYLQKSEGGQEECCAELVGLLLGQTERHTAELRESFPLTIKFLKEKLRL